MNIDQLLSKKVKTMLTWFMYVVVNSTCRPHSDGGELSWSNEESDIR